MTDEQEKWAEHLAATEPQSADRVAARQIDAAANFLSGLGEHGDANRLWTIAGRLRRRDGRREPLWPDCGCGPEIHDRSPVALENCERIRGKR